MHLTPSPPPPLSSEADLSIIKDLANRSGRGGALNLNDDHKRIIAGMGFDAEWTAGKFMEAHPGLFMTEAAAPAPTLVHYGTAGGAGAAAATAAHVAAVAEAAAPPSAGPKRPRKAL